MSQAVADQGTTPVPDGLFLAGVDEEGEQEEDESLCGQDHELPAQHVHVKGADVGVLSKAAQQVRLELVGHQLHQTVTQGELREDQEEVLQHLRCLLHLLQSARGKKMFCLLKGQLPGEQSRASDRVAHMPAITMSWLLMYLPYCICTIRHKNLCFQREHFC